MVNDRYIMSPTPIPRFDNPKMNYLPALQLFGAGREKRIYAIPPYTKVKSLDFEDYPFTVEKWDKACQFRIAVGHTGKLDRLGTPQKRGKTRVNHYDFP